MLIEHLFFLFFHRKLQLMLDRSDDNYLPSRIVVQGGEDDNLKTLKSLDLDW